jgi:hypothetical protein
MGGIIPVSFTQKKNAILISVSYSYIVNQRTNEDYHDNLLNFVEIPQLLRVGGVTVNLLPFYHFY